MKLLLDTHLALWSIFQSERISAATLELLDNEDNELLFSSICIWEVSVKYALKRPDFLVDPAILRQALQSRGDVEVPVRSEHALVVGELPLIHRDPFDRMLVAQARHENLILLTSDVRVSQYGASTRLVS